jgi:hypothetical protein
MNIRKECVSCWLILLQKCSFCLYHNFILHLNTSDTWPTPKKPEFSADNKSQKASISFNELWSLGPISIQDMNFESNDLLLHHPIQRQTWPKVLIKVTCFWYTHLQITKLNRLPDWHFQAIRWQHWWDVCARSWLSTFMSHKYWNSDSCSVLLAQYFDSQEIWNGICSDLSARLLWGVDILEQIVTETWIFQYEQEIKYLNLQWKNSESPRLKREWMWKVPVNTMLICFPNAK